MIEEPTVTEILRNNHDDKLDFNEKEPMRYLFFTNTPAHVHLYKHVVNELQSRNHTVLVLGRDYGCTKSLLEYYDLPYTLYGACNTNKTSLIREVPKHFKTIAAEARAFDPDMICGIGTFAAFAGAITRTPVVAVHDSESTTFDHLFSSLFVNVFLTPYTFQKDIWRNHYEFNGFKELAYLHPEVYEPETDIRAELGLRPDEDFAILRFNAFGSHHDLTHTGFTPEQRRRLIETLSEDTTVFVSDEGDHLSVQSLPAQTFDLSPAVLHDALAEASLLIADTQTMVTEAALLGTPAIRSNSFIGDDDMGNFIELEHYDLVRNVTEFDEVLEQSRAILQDMSVQQEWQEKRNAFIADKDNLTDVLVKILTDPEKIDAMAEVSKRRNSRHTPLPRFG